MSGIEATTTKIRESLCAWLKAGGSKVAFSQASGLDRRTIATFASGGHVSIRSALKIEEVLQRLRAKAERAA